MDINYFIDQATQTFSSPLFTLLKLSFFGSLVLVFLLFLQNTVSKKVANLVTGIFLVLLVLMFGFGYMNFKAKHDFRKDTQSSALIAYALAEQSTFNTDASYLNRDQLEAEFPELKKLEEFDVNINYSNNPPLINLEIDRDKRLACSLQVSDTGYVWDGNYCKVLDRSLETQPELSEIVSKMRAISIEK